MNLDPAVRSVPFECNIDIRDSVDYKEVMRNYSLGPNGRKPLFTLPFSRPPSLSSQPAI